ncbi:MAG: hypothetical protein QM536_03670 [Chitinophagaceae bacterium]|nr:hypothetical protein [Chitinophagaceae bacterium]
MRIFFLLYIISFSVYSQFQKPKVKQDTAHTLIKKEEVSKEKKTEKTSFRDKPFFDKIYFGGNANFGVGNITFISLSPLIGYQLTERISFGPGFIYSYYKNNNLRYSYHTYGVRLFARCDIIYNIYVYTEYEYLTNNLQIKNNAMFVGVGYFQPIYKRSGFMLTALYNLLYKGINDYYPSPLDIRFGFIF